MKFKFGKTDKLINSEYNIKRCYEKQWHKWFAWYPVCVNENDFAKARWVWLDYVWRKDDESPWIGRWIYKEIVNE